MVDVPENPVGVLDRVTQVLQAFDLDDRGISLSELARRSGLPKSTVSRVVASLVGHGYIERDGRLLHLGLRVFELGQLARRPREVRTAAVPVLLELRERTGESVHLAVRDGDDMICVAVFHGRVRAPSGVRTGARMPAHADTGGGITLTSTTTPATDATRTPRQHASAAGIRRASCAFGGAADQVHGEICVWAGADDVDIDRIGPFLSEAANTLTRRLRVVTSGVR